MNFRNRNILIILSFDGNIKTLRPSTGTNICQLTSKIILIPTHQFRIKFNGRILNKGELFDSSFNNKNIEITHRLKGGGAVRVNFIIRHRSHIYRDKCLIESTIYDNIVNIMWEDISSGIKIVYNKKFVKRSDKFEEKHRNAHFITLSMVKRLNTKRGQLNQSQI
jgi:hypothetical protein